MQVSFCHFCCGLGSKSNVVNLIYVFLHTEFLTVFFSIICSYLVLYRRHSYLVIRILPWLFYTVILLFPVQSDTSGHLPLSRLPGGIHYRNPVFQVCHPFRPLGENEGLLTVPQ